MINNSDLTDPKRDQDRLKKDEATIDMPEVRDIPGQEHIRVPNMREMQDVTISSADEEGEGILDDLNREDDNNLIRSGNDTDISRDEKEMLKSGDDFYPSKDEERLVNAAMDSTDFDGEELNEKSFGKTRTDNDLDRT